MLVMLYLVTQPTNLVAQVFDGYFEHLYIIHEHTDILPNLWQCVYLPLNVAHRFHHGAKALAHFFQKHARIVGVLLISHTTSLALIQRN